MSESLYVSIWSSPNTGGRTDLAWWKGFFSFNEFTGLLYPPVHQWQPIKSAEDRTCRFS